MKEQKRYGTLTFGVPRSLLGTIQSPLELIVEDENNIEWRAVTKLQNFVDMIRICIGNVIDSSPTRYHEFTKAQYRASFIAKPRVRLKYVEEQHRIYLMDITGYTPMAYMVFETEEMKYERYIRETVQELNGVEGEIDPKYMSEIKSSTWKTALREVKTAKDFDDEHLKNTIKYIITNPKIVMSLQMSPKRVIELIDLTDEEANQMAKDWIKKYPTLISLVAEAKLRGIYEQAN